MVSGDWKLRLRLWVLYPVEKTAVDCHKMLSRGSYIIAKGV